ncbi:DUF5642 family protein [Mycolicibacterium sp. S2-37]|uniref:DUF5642 family protein n=1 Tax=Mycolicibacterium sp. S2-37 TaxID=2810297 RepID=UPI001A93F3EF|nr:DUF5642 family protein [Mycolicibacterium sp. S2-37]MBO0679330.1 DUF5642 family protein [Mycolicibacterium sp. S2-37]
MSTPKSLTAVACVALLAPACGSDAQAPGEDSTADIANISEVRSTFGPQFQYRDIAPTGIDPKLLQPQPVPEGVTFQPPECAKYARGLLPEAGLKGNMAAATAEGEGNRFIAIAVETSEPIVLDEADQRCRKVEFSGPQVRGLVEAVEAPVIEGARTSATHRVVQTVVGGVPRTGELYNYVASFDSYLVIVTANPLVIPGQRVVPVNTQRARDLLSAAVADVRG